MAVPREGRSAGFRSAVSLVLLQSTLASLTLCLGVARRVWLGKTLLAISLVSYMPLGPEAARVRANEGLVAAALAQVSSQPL